MSELNLLDNRPLARAAIWFLVDAAVVLSILCGMILNPDLAPDHPPLMRLLVILMTTLFSLFAITSSVLGFLANCKPGRTTGSLAIIALLFGWGIVGYLTFA